MLTKAWKKIDRFYLILAFVVLVLSVPLILAAKGIFSSLITAFEIDTSVGTEVRIEKSRLDEAVTSVYDKDIPPLEVRESSFTIVENNVNDKE